MKSVERSEKPEGELRRGWTTGACATAATKAALTALLTDEFPDPVSIKLPKGEEPAFALSHENKAPDFCEVGIIKDAGDDPDVTHGATIIVRVEHNKPGDGIEFRAGDGVGTVTRSGLPVVVGEAAINPVPRQMMTAEINTLCGIHGVAADFTITISVPGGEKIAERTWNPRLGIKGGISILGTTGIVHPFSCSAWIHSIHRGIDVCRAAGIGHALGATGSTSETAACALYGFPDYALLDMGDFAGGLLKYLRDNPIAKISLAGGFAKFTKLASGSLDLHSGRSQVDFDWLAKEAAKLGIGNNLQKQIRQANTAMAVLELIKDSNIDLPGHIATLAQKTSLGVLRDAPVAIEILIFDRTGNLLARTDWKSSNA